MKTFDGKKASALTYGRKARRGAVQLVHRLMMVAVALFAHASSGYAAYTYELLDHPDFEESILWGINNSGTIIGENEQGYMTIRKGVVTPLGGADPFHGFVGINERGDLAGSAETIDDYENLLDKDCIVKDKHGVVTTLSPPSDNGDYCEGRSVAPNGDVSGFTINADGLHTGFVYDSAKGSYSEFLVDSPNVIVHQINGAGQIVGSTRLDALGQNYGFLRERNGTIRLFQVNIDGVRHATRARGVTDAGLVAGNYSGPSVPGGRVVGYVGYLPKDPSDQNLIPSEIIDIAECAQVWLQGINNQGTAVGYCQKPGGSQHGLIVRITPEGGKKK